MAAASVSRAGGGVALRLRTLGTFDVTLADPSSGRVSVQPKRLALLAYLTLTSGQGPHSRDAMLALFWPALPPDEGRRALRQALFHLRRTIGPAVLVAHGDGGLAVDPAAVWCDALAFEQALDAARPAEALALYQGDFLSGVQVMEVSPAWDAWAREVRTQLRARADAARETQTLPAAPRDEPEPFVAAVPRHRWRVAPAVATLLVGLAIAGAAIAVLVWLHRS